MGKEECLVFIKPEFIWNRENIWRTLDALVLPYFGPFERTEGEMLWHPSRELLAAHYAHIAEPFPRIYSDMLRTFPEGGLHVRVYRGEEGLIDALRYHIGDTNPRKAEEGTIRFMFSDDDLIVAKGQGRAVHNVVHASGNPKEGRVEVARFRPYLKNFDFVKVQ